MTPSTKMITILVLLSLVLSADIPPKAPSDSISNGTKTNSSLNSTDATDTAASSSDTGSSITSTAKADNGSVSSTISSPATIATLTVASFAGAALIGAGVGIGAKYLINRGRKISPFHLPLVQQTSQTIPFQHYNYQRREVSRERQPQRWREGRSYVSRHTQQEEEGRGGRRRRVRQPTGRATPSYTPSRTFQRKGPSYEDYYKQKWAYRSTRPSANINALPSYRISLQPKQAKPSEISDQTLPPSQLRLSRQEIRKSSRHYIHKYSSETQRERQRERQRQRQQRDRKTIETSEIKERQRLEQERTRNERERERRDQTQPKYRIREEEEEAETRQKEIIGQEQTRENANRKQVRTAELEIDSDEELINSVDPLPSSLLKREGKNFPQVQLIYNEWYKQDQKLRHQSAPPSELLKNRATRDRKVRQFYERNSKKQVMRGHLNQALQNYRKQENQQRQASQARRQRIEEIEKNVRRTKNSQQIAELIELKMKEAQYRHYYEHEQAQPILQFPEFPLQVGNVPGGNEKYLQNEKRILLPYRDQPNSKHLIPAYQVFLRAKSLSEFLNRDKCIQMRKYINSLPQIGSDSSYLRLLHILEEKYARYCEVTYSLQSLKYRKRPTDTRLTTFDSNTVKRHSTIMIDRIEYRPILPFRRIYRPVYYSSEDEDSVHQNIYQDFKRRKEEKDRTDQENKDRYYSLCAKKKAGGKLTSKEQRFLKNFKISSAVSLRMQVDWKPTKPPSNTIPLRSTDVPKMSALFYLGLPIQKKKPQAGIQYLYYPVQRKYYMYSDKDPLAPSYWVETDLYQIQVAYKNEMYLSRPDIQTKIDGYQKEPFEFPPYECQLDYSQMMHKDRLFVCAKGAWNLVIISQQDSKKGDNLVDCFKYVRELECIQSKQLERFEVSQSIKQQVLLSVFLADQQRRRRKSKRSAIFDRNTTERSMLSQEDQANEVNEGQLQSSQPARINSQRSEDHSPVEQNDRAEGNSPRQSTHSQKLSR